MEDTIEVVATTIPSNALQQDWEIVAIENIDVVDGTHVKGIEAGQAKFAVRSIEKPSVTQEVTIMITTDPDIEGFSIMGDEDETHGVSMDNTKQEIQDYLDGLGIEYNQNETKQQLLDKLD